MTEFGWCVWITGLPGSGKSVVSNILLKLLSEKNIRAQLLSSDAFRKVLTPDPSYSLEERDMVYRTLIYAAELLTQNGVNAVIDATGNLRRYRDEARKKIPRFFEIYLKCPLKVCMEREAGRGTAFLAPKNIYLRALEGKAPTVPGVGQPYEPPLDPEAVVDTVRFSPGESAQRIVRLLPAEDGKKGRC